MSPRSQNQHGVEPPYESGSVDTEPEFLKFMLHLELGGQNVSLSHELVSDFLFSSVLEERSFLASTEILPLVKGEWKEHGFCVTASQFTFGSCL